MADFVPRDLLLNKAHLNNLEARTKLQPTLPEIRRRWHAKGRQRVQGLLLCHDWFNHYPVVNMLGVYLLTIQWRWTNVYETHSVFANGIIFDCIWHQDFFLFIFNKLVLKQYKKLYYIFKLERALWLVNLASRTLLHGPLKFKVLFVTKLLRDLSPNFLTLIASKSLKLSFTLNCVLKSANDLKTISNWFVLLSTCFRNFEAVPHEWKSFQNPSDTK